MSSTYSLNTSDRHAIPRLHGLQPVIWPGDATLIIPPSNVSIFAMTRLTTNTYDRIRDAYKTLLKLQLDQKIHTSGSHPKRARESVILPQEVHLYRRDHP